VAWAVLLVGMAIFFHALRTKPPAPWGPRELVTLFLPFQIWMGALLVLFWVGAFPGSWPCVRQSSRRVQAAFLTFVVSGGLFWLYFYAHFVFQLV